MGEIRANFRRNLIHATKYVGSRPLEPRYVNEFFPAIHQYVQKLKQQKLDITPEELEKIMNDDIFEMSKTVFLGCCSPDMYVEYACSLYLERNPAKTVELIEKIEAEHLSTEHEGFHSTQNFEEDLLEYLLVLKNDYPEILQSYSEQLLDAPLRSILESPTLSVSEKAKKADAYIRSEVLPRYHKLCKNAVNYHLYGMRTYIPEDRRNQEKDIKDVLVKYISAITSQLDKFGLLDRYSETHEKQMRQMNLPDLCYSDKDLELLLNPNYLNTLDVDDLLALGVFWLNRYTKELDTYAEAMFAIREFNLLPQMLSSDNIYSVRLPEDQIKEVLIKMNTLYYPSETFFQRQQQEYDNSDDDRELSPEEEEGNYVIFSYDPLVEEMLESYGDEYAEYFNQGLPNCKNDLESDVHFYAKLQNPITSAKSTKDEFLTALLISLEINPNLVNGGIILDESLSPNQQLRQRFSGLALDCKLTAPLRQHIRFSVLKDFLLSFKGDAKVQIYEGNDDFKDPLGRTLSNQMILPFSKKSEKTLRSLTKKNAPGVTDSNRKYIAHLEFLREPKHIPEHLRTTITNSKGKEERIFQKRYFDLEDGKIYFLENGMYIPQENSNKTKGDFSYDDEER